MATLPLDELLNARVTVFNLKDTERSAFVTLSFGHEKTFNVFAPHGTAENIVTGSIPFESVERIVDQLRHIANELEDMQAYNIDQIYQAEEAASKNETAAA